MRRLMLLLLTPLVIVGCPDSPEHAAPAPPVGTDGATAAGTGGATTGATDGEGTGGADVPDGHTPDQGSGGPPDGLFVPETDQEELPALPGKFGAPCQDRIRGTWVESG